MTKTMHDQLYVSIITMATAATVGLAGEPSFTGNWKLNLHKSQLSGQTFTVEQTVTTTRVSGGPGLLGKWKSTQVKGSATSMVITMKGKNGITLEYPEFQQVCKGRFDGKDHTLTQAGAASKITLTFERAGADAFKITTKLRGKPIYVDTLTLSRDGNSLTDDGNGLSANEPVKSIYERQ